MIGGIIQARMGSTRLPEKVLKKINGTPLIIYLLNRLKFCKYVNLFCVATSVNKENDILKNTLIKNNFKFFRGSENNVLKRYIDCAKNFNIKTIIRITGDNPLTFPDAIDKTVKEHIKNNADYSSTSGLPLGTGIEIVELSILEKINKLDLKDYHKEHVTIYIRENRNKFNTQNISFKYSNSKLRLTVDEDKDFKVVNKIIKMLHKNGDYITMDDIFSLYRTHPNIFKENCNVVQKLK